MNILELMLALLNLSCWIMLLLDWWKIAKLENEVSALKAENVRLRGERGE